MVQNIVGFDQEEVRRIQTSGVNVDVKDLVLLLWFSKSFQSAIKMSFPNDSRQYAVVDNGDFYRDYPSCWMEPGEFHERLRILVAAKALAKKDVKRFPGLTVYTFGKAYSGLVCAER